MGKIVGVMPVEDIIKNNIDTYIKDSTQAYPNFLDTAPVFVTYYSKSAYKSTYDESFEAYNEIVGSESPNKYHKIENLPIYSLDTSDFGTDLSDDGWTGEVSSSGILLPDMVKPLPDDLIELSIHSKKYLFQVTNGTSDNFGNSKFYKISFRLSQYKKDEAERQVSETFKVDYNLIGKGASPVVQKNYHEFLDILRAKYDALLGAYKETFFDSSSQAFVFKDLGILDQFLNTFLTNNGLLTPFTQYRNSTVISPTLKKYTKLQEYNKTIFAQMERIEFEAVRNSTVFLNADAIGRKQYEFFYMLRNKYALVKHATDDPNLSAPFKIIIPSISTSTDINQRFIHYFLNVLGGNKAVLNPDTTLTNEEIFVALLEEIDKIEIRFDTLFDNVSNIDLPDYYLTPLILFALKQVYLLITRTCTNKVLVLNYSTNP